MENGIEARTWHWRIVGVAAMLAGLMTGSAAEAQPQVDAGLHKDEAAPETEVVVAEDGMGLTTAYMLEFGDDKDWIRLLSGEWLRGNVERMRDGAIEFNSDELKLITYDWKKVTELHSPKANTYNFTDATDLTGPAMINEEFVTVQTVDGVVVRKRSELQAIIEHTRRERNYWSTVLRLKWRIEGFEAGIKAAVETGFEAQLPQMPSLINEQQSAIQPLWLVPSPHAERQGPKQFVDYQNDTSASDIKLAIQEGYRSIEHIKRYTALGFGTDQGKLGNINGMAIAAQTLGKSIPETGTTTFRPAYTPVTFGAIAGAELGDLFDPIRKTAIHPWHLQQGAEFEDVGQWKRPWYYPKNTEDIHAAVNRESRATRDSVGIIDASTLGKIDIKGPDAAEFLNRMYTNAWKKLAIGRCRYGLMLGEDGMVMDDGVTTRIGENHYYMTTTTGGAANVMSWLERWLQTEWPELKVFLTSVTDHWATIGLAGPNARNVIEKVCSDIDFDPQAFPFMSMQEGTICDVAGRVFRISFSGELSFEINVPADYGHHVWQACMRAGEEFNITAYGTETMHVLRAEKGFIIVGQDTDGSMTPNDLGMDWIVSKSKDFIGRRSLSRSDCTREGRKQLVGLKTEIAHQVLPEGAQLVADANDLTPPVPMIGHVSSSYFSPTFGHSIALALVKGGRSKMGEKVYAPLADGRILVAEICDPVFYDPKGDRQNV